MPDDVCFQIFIMFTNKLIGSEDDAQALYTGFFDGNDNAIEWFCSDYSTSSQPISPLLATQTRQLVPTYTPTPTIMPTPMPTPMPTWTPEPAPTVAHYNQFIQLKPTCTPRTGYQQCYDPILGISFEYPTEWGESQRH